MIRYGVVVAVNPAQRTVDLVDLQTNKPIAQVEVLSPHLSSDGGEWSVPSVQVPASPQAAGSLPPTGRRLVAAYDFDAFGHPAITGFKQVAAGQIAVTDQDRYLFRKNGVVESIDAAGNYQFSAGAVTVRMGTAQVENLSDVAANGNWEVQAGAPTTTTIQGPGWSIIVDQNANATVQTTGNISANCQNATIQATGSASVLAANSVVLGAAGGKRVVVDGDPVSTGGVVQATQQRVTAA